MDSLYTLLFIKNFLCLTISLDNRRLTIFFTKKNTECPSPCYINFTNVCIHGSLQLNNRFEVLFYTFRKKRWDVLLFTYLMYDSSSKKTLSIRKLKSIFLCGNQKMFYLFGLLFIRSHCSCLFQAVS